MNVHHFVTMMTAFLTLVALVVACLAISGHIDYRDDSIDRKALKIEDGFEILLAASGDKQKTSFAQAPDIDGLAAEVGKVPDVTVEDLSHFSGHSAEASESGAHTVVDTNGLALKSGNKKYVTLSAASNADYALTFPATRTTGVLSVDGTTGNISMGSVSGASALHEVTNGTSGAPHTIKNDEKLTFGTSAGDFVLDSAADTEIDAVNILLSATTDITLDAGGSDIFLKQNGTTFGALVESSNELVIKSGTSPTTAMTFAGANVTHAGSVTVTTDLTVSGSDITLGNGANSSIKNEATAHNVAGTTMTITAGSTTAGTTDDIAGGSLTIQGGQGKGTGSGGDIIFQVANSSTTGNTLNSYATALTISDDKKATFAGVGEFTGALTANSGITVANAALTINNQAITQNTGGQVTFAGNVDAGAGLDVTGDLTVTASATTGDALAITGNTVTTGDVIDISATGLTDGSVLKATSTSTITDAGTSKPINLALTNDGVGDQTAYGLFLDYNKTGTTATGKTSNVYGVHIDLDDSVTNVGTVNAYGIDVSSVFANAGGTVTAVGAQLAASGADTNIGLLINCSDTNNTDLKITSSADTSDFFSITTVANGATTIATVDDGAAAAHLTFNVDGTVKYNAPIEVGVNGTGYDVKFFGETTDAYMMWDHTNDQLELVNAPSTGEHLLFIDNKANVNALKINSLGTSANTIHVQATHLTTGGILDIESTSGDVSARSLVTVHNNNAAAVGATLLAVTNDAVASTAGQTVLFETTVASETNPLLSLKNSNADANGPILLLNNSTGTSPGSNNDVCGTINFNANDDQVTAVNQSFATVKATALAVTSGSEQGQLTIGVACTDDGGVDTVLTIEGGANAAGSTTTIAGNLDIPTSKLKINGTAVNATAAELNTYILTVRLDDISTISSCYVVAPKTGTLTSVKSIIDGAITSGDAVITVNVNGGTDITNTLTIASGSGAATIHTMTPGDNNTISAGQYIKLTTDGGSANSVKAVFTLEITY